MNIRSVLAHVKSVFAKEGHVRRDGVRGINSIGVSRALMDNRVRSFPCHLEDHPMPHAATYHAFKSLHEGPTFIMPNAWDAMSALLVKQAGFKAIGSSSLAIAFGAGVDDGAHAVSRADAVANAGLMARVSGLAVNGDLEDGFGASPEDCVLTVEAAIAAGLAGLGLEDTTANPSQPIHAFDHAVKRVAAAAKAAHGRILLTGRTDNYLNGNPDLDDTIKRLVAFAEAGADVLFAPGLPDMDAIRAVVKAVAPKPVNVVVGPGVPLSVLAEAGVRRVSIGGALYRKAMTATRETLDALAHGKLDTAFKGVMTSRECEDLLPSL
jgi:2-methylisocitrate lyase-like PEP mutase family enzyme